MVARLKNDNVPAVYEIHEAMFLINSTRPASRQYMSEWFGFADTFSWIANRLFQQTIKSFKHCLVVRLPIEIILPTKGSENQAHYEILWTLRSPAFA